MKNYFFTLILVFLGIWTSNLSSGFSAPLVQSPKEMEFFPVASKGRFRPLEAYARLWLYEIYHRQSLTKSDLEYFPFLNGSALDFMWKVELLGHTNWDESPLFYLKETQLPHLLQLLPKERYSYKQLKKNLEENVEANLNIIKPLVIYHVAKKIRESQLLRPVDTIELSSLASGLRVTFKGEDVVIMESPKQFPWQYLEKGMVVAEKVKSQLAQTEIKHRELAEDVTRLLTLLTSFEEMNGMNDPLENAFKNTYEMLKQNHVSPKETLRILESRYPLSKRLRQASRVLLVLPSRIRPGEWYPLKALKIQTYDPLTQTLHPVKNFTSYPDSVFESLQKTYSQLENAMQTYAQQQDFPSSTKVSFLQEKLIYLLQQGYTPLAGTSVKEASLTAISYPTWGQLRAEVVYYRFPWIETTGLFFGFACLSFLFHYSLKLSAMIKGGLVFLVLGFLFNTLLLLIRCYILGRPPVSNMLETALYVPWVAVAVSFILWYIWKSDRILAASALAAFGLFTILQFAQIGNELENVQAVLNSRYWLIIHVLMVVGSYGAFILCGIMGHFYLLFWFYKTKDQFRLSQLGKLILQSMYMGTALLIPGTILGGVWAAESWGRFWDWDPKESWAFISSCIYLVFIHAYRFRKIHYFGLAIGSVVGMLAISFTWYGVNYILGAGLHTYGFGSGGERIYYIFVVLEVIFVGTMIAMNTELMPRFKFSDISQKSSLLQDDKIKY